MAVKWHVRMLILFLSGVLQNHFPVCLYCLLNANNFFITQTNKTFVFLTKNYVYIAGINDNRWFTLHSLI